MSWESCSKTPEDFKCLKFFSNRFMIIADGSNCAFLHRSIAAIDICASPLRRVLKGPFKGCSRTKAGLAVANNQLKEKVFSRAILATSPS